MSGGKISLAKFLVSETVWKMRFMSYGMINGLSSHNDLPIQYGIRGLIHD